MSKVADIATKLATPIVDQLGYELVDIEYVSEHKDWYINIYIDKTGGITFDDCETVSRALDPIFDEADPTEGKPYILCVSSPGLDRPLKTQRDFDRNMGKKVDVKLYKNIDGKKLIVGEISAFNGEELVLKCDENQVTLKMTDVAQVKLHIDF